MHEQKLERESQLKESEEIIKFLKTLLKDVEGGKSPFAAQEEEKKINEELRREHNGRVSSQHEV